MDLGADKAKEAPPQHSEGLVRLRDAAAEPRPKSERPFLHLPSLAAFFLPIFS